MIHKTGADNFIAPDNIISFVMEDAGKVPY